MTEATFEIRGLSAGYPHGRPISVDLDLTIERGSFVAIIGPNACGKSTLLRTIARLLPALAGSVLLDGRDIRTRGAKELARELGLLSQSAEAPDGMRVADLIARGRYPHRRAFSGWSETDEQAVRRAMERTAVQELADRPVDELSGGQRQRVWLAMALAQETDVLLLDEPTTFLDITHQLDMLDLFRAINREQRTTVVAVLHDLNQAARYADRIVAMRDGEILSAAAPEEVLTPEVMARVFDLDCTVISDPETATPMVVPRRR
ncbi:ABC transporter ATP-binding protein [Microbacterium sp. MYb66]|uniref:ABC transporter ATP-binding protein n=1 Tax=Microbacterium sp. MYb66 TaxID=1848692 RepID=UPI000CFE46EB|nr:ABC transporter ATP-binding protein [Microbacterium sp. MYb66]PRA79394.1 Fe(3+)-dicitrate ABC transporter ATP-binding protein [Microbacterium sp. MYb66]